MPYAAASAVSRARVSVSRPRSGSTPTTLTVRAPSAAPASSAGRQYVGSGVRPEREELDVAHREAGVVEPAQRLAGHRRTRLHRVLVLALGDGLDPDADEVVAGLGGGGHQLGRGQRAAG